MTTATRVVALLLTLGLLVDVVWLAHHVPLDLERIAKLLAAVGVLAKIGSSK